MKALLPRVRSIRLAFALGCLLGPWWLTARGGEYLPLTPNAEWVMDASFESPNGMKSKGTARRKLEEVVKRGGVTYLRSRSSVEGGGFPRQEYTKLVRKSVNGFYSIDERSARQVEEVEIVLPLRAGNSWRVRNGPKAMKHTVIGMESVTVGGRKYDQVWHLRGEADDGSYVEDYWEAPDTGNIKAEIRVGGGKIVLTLRSYSAGKK